MLSSDIEGDGSAEEHVSAIFLPQVVTANATGVAGMADEKPLLRGWLHAVAAPLTLLLTLAFVARAGWDDGHTLPLLLYGLAMTELYAVSAIFHRGRWQPQSWHLLRLVDHTSIYIAIAASDTALCLASLTGWPRVALPVAIWLLALVGIALKLRTPHMPRTLSTALYLGLGWALLPALPALWAALSANAHLLLLVAGLCYTIGASIYARRKPDPLPSIFGYHELFHLLVVTGGFAVFLAFSSTL